MLERGMAHSTWAIGGKGNGTQYRGYRLEGVMTHSTGAAISWKGEWHTVQGI